MADLRRSLVAREVPRPSASLDPAERQRALDEIDARAIKALAEMNHREMRSVLADAKAIGYLTIKVQEVEKLLFLSPLAFAKLEVDAARRMGDLDRLWERQTFVVMTDLMDRYGSIVAEQFGWWTWSQVKSPEQYGASGFCFRVQWDRALLEYFAEEAVVFSSLTKNTPPALAKRLSHGVQTYCFLKKAAPGACERAAFDAFQLAWRSKA